MAKRIVSILLVVLLFVLTVYTCVACTESNPAHSSLVDEYNGLISRFNKLVTEHNDSIQLIIDANTALDKEISSAQALVNSGKTPFDMNTHKNLELAIQDALECKVVVPDSMSIKEEVSDSSGITEKDVEELQAVTEALTPISVPDYTSVFNVLSDAQDAFENSVLALEQITAPSDAFVIDCIKQIDSIISIDAVTKSNDPNGLLGTKGGYIGCVYFSDSRVDKTLLNLQPGEYDTISMGAIGGGAIEVYRSIEDAEGRNAYLSSYDGTTLDPGSHIVVGTVVIRTSSMLTKMQQNELTNQIISLMTEVVG